MADSNITKRALGAAFKELMEEVPFKKISISDICEKCHMNRKSFYYHFKDKYDLVNWIFDTEFVAAAPDSSGDPWPLMEALCRYFYENRSFYQKILQIQGQNSFCEHFRGYVHPLLCRRIAALVRTRTLPQAHVNFFADGIVCFIMRWLLDKDCMHPEEFVRILDRLMASA